MSVQVLDTFQDVYVVVVLVRRRLMTVSIKEIPQPLSFGQYIAFGTGMNVILGANLQRLVCASIWVPALSK